MTIQKVHSRGRISMVRIQNFTIERRHSVIPLVYGTLILLFAIIMASINPLERITSWFLDVGEGSFVFRMWEDPPYQLRTEVWVYNYTNIPEYISQKEKVLRVEEVGPFLYRESRTNLNMSIDPIKGTMKMKPNIDLTFLPEESIGHTKDIAISVPNIALIAISTMAADRLGYIANVGAYYSMTGMGSKLFLNMSVDDYLWGYEDPIVTIANNFLPGWIDFGKIGIMDRFYGQKTTEAEVEISNLERRFAIASWDKSAGLVERGFTDWNTSSLCTRIKGAYEGLMVSPKTIQEKVVPIFRKQACRVIPFAFEKEFQSNFGFNAHRFTMEKSAFSRSSRYACNCTENCLPDGFVDISSCYYGFPIALSKPHFLDVDPEQAAFFEGMKPDVEKHTSQIDLEPNIGIPLALSSMIQVNVAVRTSAGNPITKPLKDKVVPLVWVSLFCKEPPPQIISILRLRFVIAPPLLITVEILLFVIGFLLGTQGVYRIMRPKYKLIEPVVVPKPRRRKSSVAINMSDNKAFKDDEDLAKEAVSLLAIREEDNMDLPDLIMAD